MNVCVIMGAFLRIGTGTRIYVTVVPYILDYLGPELEKLANLKSLTGRRLIGIPVNGILLI